MRLLIGRDQTMCFLDKALVTNGTFDLGCRCCMRVHSWAHASRNAEQPPRWIVLKIW